MCISGCTCSVRLPSQGVTATVPVIPGPAGQREAPARLLCRQHLTSVSRGWETRHNEVQIGLVCTAPGNGQQRGSGWRPRGHLGSNPALKPPQALTLLSRSEGRCGRQTRGLDKIHTEAGGGSAPWCVVESNDRTHVWNTCGPSREHRGKDQSRGVGGRNGAQCSHAPVSSRSRPNRCVLRNADPV